MYPVSKNSSEQSETEGDTRTSEIELPLFYRIEVRGGGLDELGGELHGGRARTDVNETARASRTCGAQSRRACALPVPAPRWRYGLHPSPFPPTTSAMKSVHHRLNLCVAPYITVCEG